MSAARARAAALALACGLVTVLPSLMMPAYRNFFARRLPDIKASWANSGRFTHFAIVGGEGNDTVMYGARVALAAREFPPGDPYYDGPASRVLMFRDGLTFSVLGLFNRLVGNLDLSWVLLRVLLVGVFFLGLSAFLRHCGAPPGPAELTAVFLCVYGDLAFQWLNIPVVDSVKNFIRLAPWLIGGDHYYFGISRFLRPAVNYPALLWAGLLTMRAFDGGRGPLYWAAAAGAAGGLLVYVHPDVWIVYVTAAGLLAAWEMRRAKAFHPASLTLLAATALVSAPYVLVAMNPDTETVTTGKIPIVDPGFWPWCLAYLAAAVLFLRQEDDASAAFRWSGAAAAGVFLQQNLGLVAPFSFRPDYTGAAANVFVLPALAALALRRLGGAANWTVLTLAVLLAGGFRCLGYSNEQYRNYGLPADYDAAFAWLKAHTAPGSVVATLEGEVSLLLPIHAHNRTLAARAEPVVSLTSNDELLNRTRYGIDLFVPEARRADAVAAFSKPGGNPFRVRQGWSGVLDREPYYDTPAETVFSWGLIPHDIPGQAKSLIPYDKLIRLGLEKPVLKPYRVDYLWDGPVERRLRGVSGSKPPAAGALLYENATVSIFARRPA